MTSDPVTVFIATCDLSGQVRGRSVPSSTHEAVMARGVGWVPANLALPSFGPIAPNPFGSTGDLRLVPDPATAIDLPGDERAPGVRLVLADQTNTDGSTWASCPRSFAKRAFDDLRSATGLELIASFEHEFMVSDLPESGAFSFTRHRGIEPFGSQLVDVLEQVGLEPETWLPEYAEGQFEITLRPSEALTAADRAILLKEVIREYARRHGHRTTFAPMVHPERSGNGVHVHFSFRDVESGEPAMFDPAAEAGLGVVGSRFAAGVLRHARALMAITAPNPTSYLRLTPHRWSAGGVFLAERNREALLRICPTSTIGGGDPVKQYNLEFRAADATANPWLVLGGLARAGLAGITGELATPTIWPEAMTEDELVGVQALPSDLEEALAELENDAEVASWFDSDLLETHCSVKRAEIAAVHKLTPVEQCRRFADVY